MIDPIKIDIDRATKKYKFVLEKEGRTNAHRRFSFFSLLFSFLLSFVSPSFFLLPVDKWTRVQAVDNNQREAKYRRTPVFPTRLYFNRKSLQSSGKQINVSMSSPVCITSPTFMHIAPTKGYIVTSSRKLVMSLRTPMRFRSYALVICIYRERNKRMAVCFD